jgi:hypothetical protein
MEEATTKVRQIAHQTSGQKITKKRASKASTRTCHEEYADIHVTPGSHRGTVLRRGTKSFSLQREEDESNGERAYHSSHQDREALGLASDEYLNYHEHVYARWFGILRHYKLPTLVHAHRLLQIETDPSISRRIRHAVLQMLSFW